MTRPAFFRLLGALLTLNLLTACGAQPANLPTSTPFVPPTATPSAQPTDGVAADEQRPYAQLSPRQRARIGTQPPPLTIDTATKYLATIRTTKGEIVVELDPTAAPLTVNNFIYLALNGFYDGLTFHRVEPNFVIQGGDPLGDGSGGPGYDLPPEIRLKHVDGAIAMARRGGPPETTPSSGSQFYITIGAQPNLDGNYTVFGVTKRGQDVVRRIQVGDVIQRIDVTTADGRVVAAPPIMPLPQAACRPHPLSLGADERILGNPEAAVTLIEYADFQCPACAAFHRGFKPVFATVSDTVRLVFRHFPLTAIHDKAQLAAHAAEAAALQGKFWEMHDVLFEKQSEWSAQPLSAFTATLKSYAQSIGLDVARFERDLASAEVAARVQRDLRSGELAGVGGTPTVYLDGQFVPPDAFTQTDSAQQLRSYAQQWAAQRGSMAKRTFDAPAQVTRAERRYQLTLETTKGNVVLALDPTLAPVNVNSVVFLAQQGYFDGAPVALNDVSLGAVLMGNPTAQGNPGYTCDAELPRLGLMNQPGVVALFGDGRTSNAQFILTYSPTQRLDGRFTVIGRVEQGLEVLRALRSNEGSGEPDRIVRVVVAEQP